MAAGWITTNLGLHPSGPLAKYSLKTGNQIVSDPASRFYALIIGIDKYKYARSSDIQDLRGCVADSEDVYQYLTETRGVSHSNIVTLQDSQATRKRIMESIQAIKGSESIRRDDPILIFWAGHGACTLTPVEWNNNKHVEMLIPHDFDPDGQDKDGQGIPDYIFGGLLAELASIKGNNITVILDTCYAGSSTRPIMGSQVRGFKLSEAYVMDVSAVEADTHCSDRTLAAAKKLSWASSDCTSHVLLAATSSADPAREENRRGIFTQALVALLRSHQQPELLTYSDVILSLPPLGPIVNRQRPQCEGKHSGRHLFSIHATARGYFFRREDGQISLAAGKIHGITEHALFDLYTSSNMGQLPLLQGLRVHQVDDFRTVLQLPEDATADTLPLGGRALQTSYGARLKSASGSLILSIAQNDSEALCSEILARLGPDHSQSLGLVSTPGDDQPQLLINRQAPPEMITFELTDRACREEGLLRLVHLVKPRPDHLHGILIASSRFFHHLHRSNQDHPLKRYITVEAHLLNYQDTCLPDGENLLSDDMTMRPSYVYDMDDAGPHQCYGFTIKSTCSQPLYVWIFAFNMNDLSIDEIYRSVQASEHADTCIQPNGVLAIGYGDGAVVPQAFFMPPDEEVAVTYLKIFVSSEGLEMPSIHQPSPFSSERVMMKGAPPPIPGKWDTLELKIVQKRGIGESGGT